MRDTPPSSRSPLFWTLALGLGLGLLLLTRTPCPGACFGSASTTGSAPAAEVQAAERSPMDGRSGAGPELALFVRAADGVRSHQGERGPAPALFVPSRTAAGAFPTR